MGIPRFLTCLVLQGCVFVLSNLTPKCTGRFSYSGEVNLCYSHNFTVYSLPMLHADIALYCQCGNYHFIIYESNSSVSINAPSIEVIQCRLQFSDNQVILTLLTVVLVLHSNQNGKLRLSFSKGQLVWGL